MKIILEDFTYYGHHFDRFEVTVPVEGDIDDIDNEMVIYEAVMSPLDFERSFYPFKDEKDSV